ncbi:hypothetical protein Sm713_41820 [Streptomyces sp. TS71-3]|nr:hypothetical protein Sm713_41820 [Streptomyces sp. TS71-3]
MSDSTAGQELPEERPAAATPAPQQAPRPFPPPRPAPPSGTVPRPGTVPHPGPPAAPGPLAGPRPAAAPTTPGPAPHGTADAPGPRGEHEPAPETDPAAPAPLGVDRAPTGHPDVDALLERLADADHLAIDGHLEVYEDVHRGLRDALTELDTRPGPPPPPRDGEIRR